MDSTPKMGHNAALIASGKPYEGVVSKTAQQGTTFQYRLLAQFGVRGLQLGYEDMELGTEVKAAGKFDDLVFLYSNNDGKRRLQLLQAKYAAGEDLKVRAIQLLQEKGDFSLSVYFNSYIYMKRNSDLMNLNVKLESLIMCSNKSFKFGQKVRNCSLTKEIFRNVGRHELLNNEQLKFTCYVDEPKSAVQLIPLTLKNALVTIPKDFANRILDGRQQYTPPKYKDTKCEKSLYDSYLKALHYEVIDNSTKKFKTNFIIGSHLSASASHYRTELWFSFHERHASEERDFQIFLGEKKLELIVQENLEQMSKEVNEILLARRIVNLIVKNRDTKVISVDSSDSVIWESIDQLLDFVFVEYKGIFHFRPEFISGGWLPEMFLRLKTCLQGRMSDYELEFHELRKYSFKFENYTPPSVSERYCGDRLELDVREFLGVLSFSMEQPSIKNMEEYIKKEMWALNKTLTAKHVEDRYAFLMSGIINWAECKHGKYLTGEDIRKVLFADFITFNLQDPVPDFSGRESCLKEIHNILNNDDSGYGTNVPRTLIITGLGGMGKTELVRKFSKTSFMSYFSCVIWINADNNERLQNSFTTLALQRLGLNEKFSEEEGKDMEMLVQKIYDYFIGRRTLFVFDNADLNERIREYFPKQTRDESIYVLVTTRSGYWNGFKTMDLGNFAPEESLKFIKISIGELPIFDYNEARELASKLSHYPLAIKQAVSYIKRQDDLLKKIGQSFTISSYLALLETKSEEVLDKTFEKEMLNDYSLTAFKTMNIAVDHVQNSENPILPITVLSLMSFLSPDNIETSVMNTALYMFGDDEIAMAFDLLSNLSIISISESKARIHRLIQLVSRMRLRKSGEEEEVIEECFRLANVMEVEHLISVWEYASKHDKLVRKYIHVVMEIGKQLMVKNQRKVSLEFEKRALEVIKRCYGDDSLEALLSKERISNYQDICNMYKECAEMRKYLLVKFGDIYGDQDEQYLLRLHSYGMVIDKLGDEKLVNEIVDEVIWLLDSIPVTDPSKLLTVKEWVVEKLKNDPGRSGIREKFLAEIVSDCESFIGEYEKRLERGDFNINNEFGDFKNEILRKVLMYEELKEQKLGLYGGISVPLVISSYIKVGSMKYDEERYDESFVLWTKAKELILEVFGKDYLNYDYVVFCIGASLFFQGEYERCIESLRDDLLRVQEEGNIKQYNTYQYLINESLKNIELKSQTLTMKEKRKKDKIHRKLGKMIGNGCTLS